MWKILFKVSGVIMGIYIVVVIALVRMRACEIDK